MSPTDAASVVSSEMLGMTVSTGVMAFFVQRFDRRKLAIFVLLLVALANTGSLFLNSLSALFTLRCVAGIGEGALISLVAAALGGTATPARNFAIFMAANMFLSAVLFRAMPVLVQSYGMSGVFSVLLVLVAVAAFFLPFFPSKAITEGVHKAGEEEDVAPNRAMLTAAIALGGFLAFFVSLGIVWPLFPQFAERLDVAPSTVAAALSNATIAGLAAALIASFIGSKFGDRAPLIAGALVLLGSMLAIPTAGSGLFALAAAALMGGWMFSAPYCMATLAAADSTGRAVAFSMSLQFLGLTIGPMIGVNVNSSGTGFEAIWLGISIMLIAASLIVYAASKLRRNALLA
jgi:MFS family permease